MAMSKRDYELIAEAISTNHSAFYSNVMHAYFARDMAKQLARTSPRFDEAKFIMASMPKHLIGTAKGESVWERTAERAGT